MKNKQIFTLLILIMTSCKSCDKNNDATPSEQLPAATQEGKNTFGCLIDGKAFVPGGGGGDGPPILQCAYQYVDGQYYFLVSATKKDKNGDVLGISLFADSLRPKVTDAIPLLIRKSGQGNGLYYAGINFKSTFYYTTNEYTGELKVTRFDTVNQIASGTFWFDALDSISNTKVEVRDGRFDMQYVK